MDNPTQIKKLLLLALIVFFGLTAQSWAAPIHYEGTLSTSDGTLVVGKSWTSATLNWEVDYSYTSELWTYSYDFTVGTATTGGGNSKNAKCEDPEITRVIIQTSGDPDKLKCGDIETGTTPGWTLGTYKKSGNPGWKGGQFYGIKWVETSSNNIDVTDYHWTWTIVTDHSPMWGDFYAKGEDDSYARNSGMGTDLTADQAHNLDTIQKGYLLVPNSKGGPPNEVPVPASLMLLGSGLMSVSLIRRKRENK